MLKRLQNKSLTVNRVFFIQTDASTHGWGGVRDGNRTGGRWKPEEINSHINYLELLAILLTLKALCHDCKNKHIRVQCDNTTAVCYINNMGESKSNNCNAITKHIWEFCIHQQIWLSAAHLPGCKNTDADLASRHFNDRTEWMLDRRIFEQVATKFGYPTIDLFASRLNNQCPNYASWRPDPGAQHVNAFSVNWHNFFFYAFPPFSVIGRCLEKIQHNQAEGILIVPLWPSQSWYPKLLRLLVSLPAVIPAKDNLLKMPATQKLHPLRKKLTLLACHLCGDSTKTKAFLNKLQISSSTLGENPRINSTEHILVSGYYSVLKERLIPFVHL